MSLYNSEYLKTVYNRNYSKLSAIFLSESRRTHSSFDIFLSHSFLDKEEVGGLYQELTGMGFSVYVDWIIDPHLDRSNVTKETSELVRNRMKMSKTLLLAISSNASLSKWMPWELGYVDGNTNKCAIVPISRDNTTRKDFPRTEYLKLYPYIKRAEINYVVNSYVTESSNAYVTISDWIRNNNQPSYKSINIDEL